jgi:hypothetical protein
MTGARAKDAGVDPVFRRLTVYAFDPSRVDLCAGEPERELKVLQAADGGGSPLLGGTTLVFGDDGGKAPLRYAVTKRLDERRRDAQRRWRAGTRAPGRGGGQDGRAGTFS